MIRNALLAGGVTMAYATQLSVPGLPFGYGELFLALWIMLSVGRVLAGGHIEATPALARSRLLADPGACPRGRIIVGY